MSWRGLYAITDSAQLAGRLLPAVAAALEGGAVLVQYRDKSDDRERRLAEARDLLALCRRHGVPLLINDDVELALAVGAEGVHLGRGDGSLRAARERLGPDAIIGATCQGSLEFAEEAWRNGASYLAFGAIYPSATKPGARTTALDTVRAARRFRLPVVAIGGISADNAAPVIAAGADCVAVISDLWTAPDIAARARAIHNLFRVPAMSRSDALFEAACRHIPGGVNSPVRAFRGVGGTPVFFSRAQGAYLYDADDRRYVDYVGSWGPAILGHAHPEVIREVQEAAVNGLSFGAPTELEIRMADTVCGLLPSMDMVRMVSSGTEATMSAIRLARGYTGRDVLVKFEGCYHGHADSLLVKAGSGALTLGVPSSAGVPADLAKHTITLEYNNLAQTEEFFRERGAEVACIIVEPVAGNMNCIPPAPGFLQGLRKLCDEHGAVLIFDEVMTGFRVALGGAQALYGVVPDLTTLGKVIGGGMPVGAFGGKRAIMEKIAPLGPVYQAGTLSGNPIAMRAGLKTLQLISAPGFHERLGQRTAELCQGLESVARDCGVALTTNQVGGMFGIFFTDKRVGSYADALTCDTEAFKRFFHAMLDEGIYLAPSAFEAGFVSAAHTAEDIAVTLEAARRALKA